MLKFNFLFLTFWSFVNSSVITFNSNTDIICNDHGKKLKLCPGNSYYNNYKFPNKFTLDSSNEIYPKRAFNINKKNGNKVTLADFKTKIIEKNNKKILIVDVYPNPEFDISEINPYVAFIIVFILSILFPPFIIILVLSIFCLEKSNDYKFGGFD
jgi:hypothetical protein